MSANGGGARGGWVKARADLPNDLKVIAMTHHLAELPTFREWLAPGWGESSDPLPLRDEALRCVTCALLLRVWSVARQFGHYQGDDLLLPHISLRGLDSMAGVAGFGEAMQRVGWARETGTKEGGVILPKFKEHNIARPPAEKQRDYRQRKRDEAARYAALRADDDKRYAALRADDAKRDPLLRDDDPPTVQYSTVGGLYPPTTPFTPEPASPTSAEANGRDHGEVHKPAEPTLEPVAVLTFPCAGPRKTWALTRDQVASWAALYPKLDVLAECRKALAWVEASPSRRKTHQGMARFLVGWLGRATDTNTNTSRPTAAGGGTAFHRPTAEETLRKIREREQFEKGGSA